MSFCAKVAWQKRNLIRKNSDPGKSWITEGIGRCTHRDDALCKSGMAQGTQSQEIRPGQWSTENSERTDIRDVTLERPGMQQWHEGPRPKAATMRQQANK
jgi:hypothetical protein